MKNTSYFLLRVIFLFVIGIGSFIGSAHADDATRLHFTKMFIDIGREIVGEHLDKFEICTPAAKDTRNSASNTLGYKCTAPLKKGKKYAERVNVSMTLNLVPFNQRYSKLYQRSSKPQELQKGIRQKNRRRAGLKEVVYQRKPLWISATGEPGGRGTG